MTHWGTETGVASSPTCLGTETVVVLPWCWSTWKKEHRGHQTVEGQHQHSCRWAVLGLGLGSGVSEMLVGRDLGVAVQQKFRKLENSGGLKLGCTGGLKLRNTVHWKHWGSSVLETRNSGAGRLWLEHRYAGGLWLGRLTFMGALLSSGSIPRTGGLINLLRGECHLLCLFLGGPLLPHVCHCRKTGWLKGVWTGDWTTNEDTSWWLGDEETDCWVVNLELAVRARGWKVAQSGLS